MVERAQYINLIYFTCKEGKNSRSQHVEKLFNLSIDVLIRQQNVNYLQDHDHFLKRKNYFPYLTFLQIGEIYRCFFTAVYCKRDSIFRFHNHMLCKAKFHLLKDVRRD